MQETFKSRKPVYYNDIVEYRVVDGDTVELTIDLGYKCLKKVTVRLRDIDTPELKSKNPLEREAADLAKAALNIMLEEAKGARIELESNQLDMYGRAVGSIFLFKFMTSVNSLLIKTGLAKVHIGSSARAPWKDEDLQQIPAKFNKFVNEKEKILNENVENYKHF